MHNQDALVFWIRNEMKFCGMTLSQLADLMKIDRKSVSWKLNGKSKITFPDLCAMCWAFGSMYDPGCVWERLMEGCNE